MALTDAQKTDVRRFCGFPLFGNQPTQTFGYRYFTHYGTLEYRMNNMSAAEEAVVVNTYLANLTTLETAIVGTSTNLDTDKAAVWERNKTEHKDREELFNSWRHKLCAFFGIAPGPGLKGVGIGLIV